jgi:hypothetical protein
MSQNGPIESESGVTNRARRAIRWTENPLRLGKAA